jgi:ketosteroid isomerase-like protein
MPSMEWWNSLLASIDGKDTTKFLSYLAEDGEFVFGNAPPAVGHAAIGAAVSGFFGTIQRSQHQLLKTWADADSAVGEGRVTYTRLDGSTITLPFVDVFHFRGDKIGRYLIYMDVNPLFAGG